MADQDQTNNQQPQGGGQDSQQPQNSQQPGGGTPTQSGPPKLPPNVRVVKGSEGYEKKGGEGNCET